MPSEDNAAAQARLLTDQLRRVINRLVLVRPPAADLAAAVEAAGAFADRLDALPARGEGGEIGEAGLDPTRFIERSPVSGRSNPLAPPVSARLVTDEGGGHHVEASVTFGPAYEGPPGHVHGGYLAAMFDEVLGFAQSGPGFTGTLRVRYRRPTPLGEPLTLWAGLTHVSERKRTIRGTCHRGETLLSEAEGLFITPRRF